MARRAKRKNRGTVFLLVLIILSVIAFALYKSVPAFLKKNVYPKKYSEYVERYSEEYDIDENFIYAVIKTESGFDPDARSNVGAVGLMQLMPIAFKEVSNNIEDNKGLKYSDMYEPEYNIMYGTWYLDYLYKQFGSYELTIAAYHAGMTEVRDWLYSGVLDEDNLNLDNIPSEYSDTRHYINKVISAYKEYNRLYR